MTNTDAYKRWSYVPNKMLPETLSPGPAAEFEDIYAAILAEKNRASKHAPSAVGDFLAWNTEGKKPPLFWCFNSWAEPFLLANHLDENQPLYAMGSFSGITDKWRLKTKFNEPLAKRYIESVRQVKGASSFLIGGNCQGAPIAESIAIQMMDDAGVSPYLLSIDYIGKRTYRGQRFMLFGRESGFNPFLSTRNPIEFWSERNSEYSWDFLEGKHGTYFLEPNVQKLAEFISEKSREATPPQRNLFRALWDRLQLRFVQPSQLH